MDMTGEEKHTEDDPAVVPPQGCQRRRIASDAQDREPTGDRRRALRKLGWFCRERAYKTFFSWRDRMVGAGREGARARAEGPAPELECDPGVGVGRPYRVPAPRVGATGLVLLAETPTTTTDMRVTPGMSRRRLSKLTRPRPTSASAWLAGPMSTSTPQEKRVSGRLVKRRPKSVAMAGERDQLTTSFCAQGRTVSADRADESKMQNVIHLTTLRRPI